MDAALWYVIGDAVFVLAGGMVALAFIIAVLLLLIGGQYHPRFHILGGRGVFSRQAKYGGRETLGGIN